jgi:hypothetical protein
MQDTLDIIKNIDNLYNSDTAFTVLKDFERVLDELDLYVYENWEDGELAVGPEIDRHWVTCSFIWDRENMPDPSGAKRLTDYDCKVTYKKDSVLVPRKIREPDDMRPGTKKGKLDRKPVWLVSIQMPISLIGNMYGGTVEQMMQAVEPAVAPSPMQEPQDADLAMTDLGTEDQGTL